ncbi:amino acid ABC transporter permease [Eubacteriaceae bacterium ES2]|nr:amino acid ABC transporter permease [Eubacteriaceae bacterium ES2]
MTKKQNILPGIVVGVFYIGCIYLILFQVSDVLNFSQLLLYKEQLLMAFVTTIIISLISLVASIIIGFITFVLQTFPNRYLKYLIGTYKEIIMGTPLLVMVFVVVYIIGLALNIHDKLLLGLIAMTMYMSPYMTNVFEAAYNTIDKNQFIMMDFYGFNLYQKYRYILLPQMIKPIIPGLINNLSGIIKGTSILSTIAIQEIFYTISIISNNTYRYMEGYFVLWLVYLLITIPLSRLAQYYMKKWNV